MRSKDHKSSGYNFRPRFLLAACEACSPRTRVYPYIDYAGKIPEQSSEEIDRLWNNVAFVKKVEATYPRAARQEGIRGTVVIHARVRNDGSVFEAWVHKGVHPLIAREAIKATLQCKFRRINSADEPVDDLVRLVFEFQ